MMCVMVHKCVSVTVCRFVSVLYLMLWCVLCHGIIYDVMCVSVMM